MSEDIKYYRDFPNSYGPEIVEYLLEKKITKKALASSIMMLIYKKAIKVEKIDDTYIFKGVKKSNILLTEAETALYEWFIYTVGNKNLSRLQKKRADVFL